MSRNGDSQVLGIDFGTDSVRAVLFDEAGERIRGKDGKEAAELALAREKLTWDDQTAGRSAGSRDWLVVRVCSEYLQYCERGAAAGDISESHRYNATSFLNDLCEYCGALPVGQLKKGHVQEWIESHDTCLAGDLRIISTPAGPAAVEQPKPDRRVVRLLSDETEVRRFVRERLDTYDRMWDGCGCKVDYYT